MEPTDERLGRAINEYLNHYVLVIDTKAGAIAAASFVLAGFVVAPEAHKDITTLKLVGALLAAAAAIASGSVLYPRIPHSGNGHFFWFDIRNFDSATNYWKSLASLDAEAVGLEYARQNYSISQVLVTKTKRVRAAIWLLSAACITLVLAFGVN